MIAKPPAQDGGEDAAAAADSFVLAAHVDEGDPALETVAEFLGQFAAPARSGVQDETTTPPDGEQTNKKEA